MIFFFSYKKENLVDIVHQGFCFVSWVPVLVDIGPSNLGVKMWLKTTRFISDPIYIYVKVGPPVHNYEHEAGSYGDGFT